VRAAIAVVALGACAWDDGVPMGSVTVTVDARWTARADRGGDWQRLASDFEVQVTSASAELGALTLIDLGRGALPFDPADPPPGYGLCHNGHCHSDDGRLVPYEEIAAELTGGAPPPPALVVDVGARGLIPGAATVVACDGGPCDLDRAAIGRIDLDVVRLDAAGMVRDRRTPPRIDGERAWTLVLERGDDTKPVSAQVDLPVDRGHDPAIALTAGFAPSAALLDGVRFAELGDGPDAWTVDQDAASIAAIEEALGELELAVQITRGDL
jgi:hypothetical protein